MFSIIIYYCTGTGNSKRVADLAANAWRARGAEVMVQSVEGSLSFAGHKKADFIGIVAPVYGFGLPPMMVRFLKTLPDGTGQRAFVLVATGNAESLTWGGRGVRIPPSEGIALLQARYWLKRRDYTLRCAAPIEMPTNWTLVTNPPGNVRQSVLFDNAAAAIDRHVHALYHGQLLFARTPYLWTPLFALTYWLFIHIGRRVAGKCFTATHRCNRCGYCRDHCPAGAIGWLHNRPYWGWNCQQCYRCVNFCPRGAIDVPWLTLCLLLLAMLIGYMPYDSLPAAVLMRLGNWNSAAATVFYLVVTLLTVWLLHYLHACPLTRWLLPRWYVMRRRARYREPHFVPESRILIGAGHEPARLAPTDADATVPNAKHPRRAHQILVKPPTDAEQAAERKKWGRKGL